MTDDRPSLADALNFTDDDLTANRAGRLSDVQSTRLRARAGYTTLAGALIALALAGGGFWLIALGATLAALALFALAAGLFVLTRWGRGTAAAEVAAGAVACVSGEAVLSANDYPNPNGNVTEYVLEIGDEAFVLSRDAFAAFEDGDTYTVYYLPGLRMVISAEGLARQTPTG